MFWGLRDGASENQIVCKALLEDLVERGLSPERCRLFVIDGSKALRVAVDAVFGTHNKVQRCRKHKERNVLGYLPQELKPQVQASLRSAWQLPAKKGKARLEQQAKWLEDDYPSAAESIREGLDEMFTINELDLPASLKRCLGSALLHGSEQIADLPVPVAESPGAVRIGHPERGHLVEYLAPNSVFNSLPRQRSSPHLRPDDRLVTIDRVFHHASLGAA